MSRAEPRSHRGIAAVIVVLGLYAVAVTALTLAYPETPGDELPPPWNAVWGITYLVLGSIVLWNRPRHVMAKVMLGCGLLALTTALTQVVGLHWTSPLVDQLEWMGIAEYVGYGTIFALLIHLFPTGQPPAPFWRWAVRLLWLGTAGLILGVMLGLEPSDGPLVAVGTVILVGSYTIGLVSSVPSLGYRFWRSRDAERAQVKWFLLAVSIALVGWFTATAIGSALTLLLPPLAITIALTRYRLYDIDRIISRTASYTIVTGVLLITYAAIVTTATRLLPDLNTLSVAAATLAAAALARPLLRRVQHAVDRRFNRAGYDAQHTVNAFVGRLASEVSPAAVMGDLQNVVGGALEPSLITVWTREST